MAKRQLECPPGVHCGAGPVCTIHDCDLCPEFPGCNTEVERRAVLKRQIECPPGVHCGSGPVCTIDDCDLCPDFPSCDTKVEHRASTVAKRQLKSVNGMHFTFGFSLKFSRNKGFDYCCRLTIVLTLIVLRVSIRKPG